MAEILSFNWLMLPLGIALGWYWARTVVVPGRDASPPSASPDYLRGLSQLVNEDADQAAASLLRAIESDPSSVELHFTLGSLFRKRGEMDRALRLHQNLLDMPNLSREHYNQARFELAQDYQRAGVTDRAEALFQELAGEGLYLQPVLEQTLAIQEQAREWPKAIETAHRLESVKGQSLRPVIAHYECEQVEPLRKGQPVRALQHVTAALSADPSSVRASLLQASLYESQNDWPAAIKAYRRVPEQDVRYLSEVLAPLQRCYEAQHDLQTFWKYLEELEARGSHPSVMRAKARLMLAEKMDPTVYLSEQLQRFPDWQGLDLLFESLARHSETLTPVIDALRQALAKIQAGSAPYRCSHCGLTPKILFWQCPSCKQWGSIAPV